MLGIVYIVFVFCGWLVMLLYAAKTKKFLWREYLVMFAIPLAGLLGLIYWEGDITPLHVYLAGFVVGPILEWVTGWFWLKINGRYIWIYQHLPLPGRFTSWLVLPAWGFVFVAIWALVKEF